MIRIATSADIPSLIFLIECRFHEESGYKALGVIADPFKTHASLEALLAGGGVIYVSEKDGQIVGAIALSRCEMYFSQDPVAIELFWWMHPDHRKGMDGARLLMKALEWAKQSGVKFLTMVDIPQVDSNAARMYERLGGKLMERSWIWRI